MSHKLEIRAFFFNAKTDYLPYYKNFNINVDAEATAKDLLAQIQEANENFSYPKQKLVMKVNGLVVEAKQPLSELVERLGTSLQIDPVNAYRSNDGLKINDDDFMKSFELLASYASEADLKYYKTLYALHYASETEKFDREYIGDAVLVLAHKMITEGSEHTEAILDAITSVNSGLFDCEYENNLFNAQDHTAVIAELKAMAKPEEGPSLCAQLIARFSNKEESEVEVVVPKRAIETIENLEEKQVAHYHGLTSHDAMHKLIGEMGMKGIHFSRSGKLSGLSILEDNKDLALKKAGAILLDAYDSGVEVLVVEDVAVLDMFKKNFSTIEKTIGRKMIGLELISADNFVSQVNSIVA
jgi:succinate dehydrogenase/fumarate reductase-like Fe-S protein